MAATRAALGPIGIVAGGGGVPLEIAARLTAAGRAVHIVALDGFADLRVADYPHTWVGLGQLGRLLGALRRAGCNDIVIVGALVRPDLTRLRFDWGAARHLPTILALTRGGDDSLLRRIVRFFEQQGFRVRGIGDVVPEMLASQGALAGPAPTPAQQAAIMAGRDALERLSRFDIGQAVVARGDGLIAVEAAEGTRRMLERIAARGRAGPDAVLVKMPKVGQELRVDMPAVGEETVAQAAAAGLSGLAVASGQTIVAARDAMADRATATGVFVTGLRATDGAAPGEVDPSACDKAGGIGKTDGRSSRPRERDPRMTRDIALAERVACEVLRLAHQGGSDAGAIVRAEHVLAVEIGALAGSHWTERLDRVPRGWGWPPRLGRSGALAIAMPANGYLSQPAEAIAALAPAARRAGLAALVVICAGDASAVEERAFSRWAGTVQHAADEAGLHTSVRVLTPDA